MLVPLKKSSAATFITTASKFNNRSFIWTVLRLYFIFLLYAVPSALFLKLLNEKVENVPLVLILIGIYGMRTKLGIYYIIISTDGCKILPTLLVKHYNDLLDRQSSERGRD